MRRSRPDFSTRVTQVIADARDTALRVSRLLQRRDGSAAEPDRASPGAVPGTPDTPVRSGAGGTGKPSAPAR